MSASWEPMIQQPFMIWALSLPTLLTQLLQFLRTMPHVSDVTNITSISTFLFIESTGLN